MSSSDGGKPQNHKEYQVEVSSNCKEAAHDKNAEHGVVMNGKRKHETIEEEENGAGTSTQSDEEGRCTTNGKGGEKEIRHLDAGKTTEQSEDEDKVEKIVDVPAEPVGQTRIADLQEIEREHVENIDILGFSNYIDSLQDKIDEIKFFVFITPNTNKFYTTTILLDETKQKHQIDAMAYRQYLYVPLDNAVETQVSYFKNDYPCTYVTFRMLLDFIVSPNEVDLTKYKTDQIYSLLMVSDNFEFCNVNQKLIDYLLMPMPEDE